MQPNHEPLVVPQRFHGPRRSGNGGWTAGALAERLTDPGATVATVATVATGAPAAAGRAVTVALRLPPPLDTPLAVEDRETGVVAVLDGRTVAEARVAAAELVPVDPVGVEEAEAAAARYPGFQQHPFPGCFACGPDREEGDGLRIFPGPVDGDPSRVAALWTPYDVSVPITWAALDCPGGWASGVDERPMVLGTMTARVDRLPSAGDPHVVVGALRGEEGRKSYTAASLYGPDGSLVATAEHVWVTVDVTDFS